MRQQDSAGSGGQRTLGLLAIRKVAHMLKRRLAKIVTYTTHQLANAVAEGLDSKIQ